jgi:Zn-dependent oligopeptidase
MLGVFSIDLHPRQNKYGHAAQWGLAQHKVWSDGRETKPVAALVCNFTKPTPDKPSLLSHDEVETFFHEFGHCLHTILSEGETFRFSGTGVERDFVEAPSQMFENWVWDADVLRTFARHYETDEAFPDELLAGMLAARHLGSGMLAEHQFFYGLADMAYHTTTTSDGAVDTTQKGLDLFEEVELYDRVPETFYQASFGHLTGYEAGYYGYQWSLVYACDMFQRFKELGMLSPSAGLYYRQKILGRGGTLDGLDLVRDYLGREPDMSAYLKHLGLEVEE